jgi:hypothetical protein
MKRIVAIVLLALCSASIGVSAQTRHINTPQSRADKKAQRKQAKAMKKALKAQRKNQRKMEKYDRKHTHDPNRPKH